eukprot:1136685-Pelagomonas_calceolata.AAC.1
MRSMSGVNKGLQGVDLQPTALADRLLMNNFHRHQKLIPTLTRALKIYTSLKIGQTRSHRNICLQRQLSGNTCTEA